MKPISPQSHDPLDELLAAAVHDELTAAQRAELNALLQHDPAARAAYQEIQTMHDLLENNHREAKPDPNFEDRMISAVRRKVRDEKAQRESPWESLLFIWRAIKWSFVERPGWTFISLGVACIVAMLVLVHEGQQVRGVFATINSQIQLPQSAQRSLSYLPDVSRSGDTQQTLLFRAQKERGRDDNSVAVAAKREKSLNEKDLKKVITGQGINYTETAQRGITLSGYTDTSYTYQFAGNASAGSARSNHAPSKNIETLTAASGSAVAQDQRKKGSDLYSADSGVPASIPVMESADASGSVAVASTTPANSPATRMAAPASLPGAMATDDLEKSKTSPAKLAQTAAATDTAEPARKLVRDASLDLEVKKYQPTVDAITELAKANNGYLDSSNSERGGNGKLKGAVVAKVAPDKLDAFLLKLHDLGTLKNQSVSTEDVTKDYYDTEARLTNSRKMETQLQELLKHDTNKVADLLQVERELGRVRGDIEQMQGQLKLYDFQVQYATVTIQVAEKDLNKAAAYLLQEHDNFALFVHDVEDAFAQAKAAADTFKAQILNADLQHGSGNSMSATLAFSVPPEQVDGFLAKVKALGRVDNFTRTTSRVANDGGNSDEPADETRTDKDNAQVRLAIRADDESPRQLTNLTVASTGDIDAQAQALKDDAVKSAVSVIASSFERAPDGSETAVINFRLPLAKVGDLMPTLQKLGRVEALTVSRNDRPGQVAADATAPAEIDLRLHNVAAVSFENEPPRQQTQLSVASNGNVDTQAQELKAGALKAGMAVTSSTFERQPDGMEEAQLTFRLPLAEAAAYTDTLKKLGKVESLAIQRNDVPGPNSTDPNAPAEISLTLHSEPAVVAENRGVWPTLQHLFGGGVTAFLNSVETIGVLLAFIAPWVATAFVLAFVGRRVWVMRRARS